MVDLNTSDKAKKRGVPPLVWIILVIVAGWIAYSFIVRDDERTSPSGETMPQLESGETYMPDAPARDGAPPVAGETIDTR